MTMATLELGTPGFWKRLAEDPKRIVAEVCLIDTVNMERTLTQHAGLRGWVNAAHETARIQEGKAEFELKKARARALLKAKEEKDPHTGKPKIADVLSAEVDLDEEVVRYTEVLFDAQSTRGAFRAMSSALEDRLQMLIQLSANQRRERNDLTTTS